MCSATVVLTQNSDCLPQLNDGVVKVSCKPLGEVRIVREECVVRPVSKNFFKKEAAVGPVVSFHSEPEKTESSEVHTPVFPSNYERVGTFTVITFTPRGGAPTYL